MEDVRKDILRMHIMHENALVGIAKGGNVEIVSIKDVVTYIKDVVCPLSKETCIKQVQYIRFTCVFIDGTGVKQTADFDIPQGMYDELVKKYDIFNKENIKRYLIDVYGWSCAPGHGISIKSLTPRLVDGEWYLQCKFDSNAYSAMDKIYLKSKNIEEYVLRRGRKSPGEHIFRVHDKVFFLAPTDKMMGLYSGVIVSVNGDGTFHVESTEYRRANPEAPLTVQVDGFDMFLDDLQETGVSKNEFVKGVSMVRKDIIQVPFEVGDDRWVWLPMTGRGGRVYEMIQGLIRSAAHTYKNGAMMTDMFRISPYVVEISHEFRPRVATWLPDVVRAGVVSADEYSESDARCRYIDINFKAVKYE